MPMPRFVAQINKRVFNPRQVRTEGWPLLEHVGRRSGKQHVTPIDAVPLEDGYLFFVIYGLESDWVQNVLTSGVGSLRIDGEERDLSSPRLIGRDEALRLAPSDAKFPPSWVNVTDFLVMKSAG